MKTVLITGCSSGIGLESALLLAQNRFLVFASVHSLKNLNQTTRQTLKHKNIHLLEIDVTSDQGVNRGITQIFKINSRLDVLINNAGNGYVGPVLDFSLAEAKNQFEVNLWGAFRLIKAVVPKMRAQKSGLIINLSSTFGLMTFPNWGLYCASKHALESLSEALHYELAHHGIKVSLIEPGSFKTNFFKNAVQKSTPITDSGLNPLIVSKKILDLINQKNPPLRNLVGKDAHFYYYLKKFLPRYLWQMLVNKVSN